MDRRIASPLLGLALTVVSITPVSAADRDGDGLSDRFEVRWGVTSKDKADTDGDGVVDSAEDNDRDGLGNLGEQRSGTNPRRRDTDLDGKPDGQEDKDRDGVSNAREQDRRPVPKGLTPSLADANDDYYPDRWACLSVGADTQVHPCVLGDSNGQATVAVFGDSHALQWMPAFDLAGVAKGWRVVTLLKAACSSAAVTNSIQFSYDQGVSCDQWRGNAIEWLKNHPPDLIVITNNDGYTLVPSTRSIPRWGQGMTETLQALPDSSRILVLGDTPNNAVNPVACLKRSQWNMSACVTRRVSPMKRRFRAVEVSAAKAADAQFSDVYQQICSYDPCPVVQGKILMWKDGGHLTSTFARQLTPTIINIVRNALRR